MGDILLTISSELSELTIVMISYRSLASPRSESMVVQIFIFSSSFSVLLSCPSGPPRSFFGVCTFATFLRRQYLRIYTFPDVPGLVGFSAESL